MQHLPSTSEMIRAVRQSDAGYDGVFFVAVRTTGIFCRPSCPARKPLPKNCEYHATVRQALFAGYRPCRRCRPLDVSGRPPDWVQRLLQRVEQDPAQRIRDGDLRAMTVDPARARRYFLKHYGMTFHAYCRGRRMGEAFTQIREGAKLDDVVLGNGYESHSGFREAFARTFGQPPGKSRSRECIVAAWLESPLGPLVAGATAKGICLLEFTDRRMLETQFATIRKRFDCAVVPGKHEYLEQLQSELEQYFAGKLTEFRVPLEYPGTPFQQKVWQELLRIPYGETCSYEGLADAIAAPGAQRAVGRANGQNRIGIVIPCHRVVNKGGQLGGYGGGLWRKQFLLDLERSVIAAKPVPPNAIRA
jgi:AraC family transcriptional regulator, regulatory protein of adaptative response / methylated-DNA-[protein]-cysteine methyltransferase